MRSLQVCHRLGRTQTKAEHPQTSTKVMKTLLPFGVVICTHFVFVFMLGVSFQLPVREVMPHLKPALLHSGARANNITSQSALSSMSRMCNFKGTFSHSVTRTRSGRKARPSVCYSLKTREPVETSQKPVRCPPRFVRNTSPTLRTSQ